MSRIYYAGIGSRTTPAEILTVMQGFGKWLGRKGLVLRSGAAQGADQAFEKVATKFTVLSKYMYRGLVLVIMTVALYQN